MANLIYKRKNIIMYMYERYLINISYIERYLNGQQLVSTFGVTHSVPTYSASYWIASMPEINISATGSSQPNALDNLIIAASASSGVEPLSGINVR